VDRQIVIEPIFERKAPKLEVFRRVAEKGPLGRRRAASVTACPVAGHAGNEYGTR
jgi:hypothetical protein